MKKFLKGVAFGGALGAALVFLNKTKNGKELKTRLINEAHKLSKIAIAKIPKNDYVDPKKVEVTIAKIVEQYSSGMDLAKTFKKFLTKEIKKIVLGGRGDRT